MRKQFIIQMGSKYPFGELGETITEDTSIAVRKRLHYDSEQEYEIIRHMIHFLKVARHDNLVNLVKVLEDQNEIQLLYEYVPLRLERWLLDVNQDLINSLEEQLLEVAEYLARSSIKFVFDPDAIGLTADMNIKYFLNEFAIDLQNWEENLEGLRGEIRSFFKNMFGTTGSKGEEPQKCARMESMSTNPSLSPNDDFSELTQTFAKLQVSQQKPKNSKGSMLSAKVQNSKKKCLEVLERFKKMSNK